MKKSLKVLGIIIFAGVLTICNSVYAASFKFAPTVDKSSVTPGDTIKVTLSVSDINLGSDGMNTIEAVLDYSRDVFEEVKSSDIVGQNGWNITYNDENSDLNGKLLAMSLSGVKTDQSFAVVTMKVKSSAKVQNAKITFSDIASNDGTDIVSESNKTITIAVKSSSSNTGGNNSGSTGGTTPKLVVPTSSTGTTTSTSAATTTSSSVEANDSIPQTGEGDAIIIALILAAIGFGIVAFIKYRKLK